MNEAQLTDHARAVLQAVRDFDGAWVGRADIAGKLAQKRVNHADIALLEMLVSLGIIEHRRKKDATPIGFKHEYRAK